MLGHTPMMTGTCLERIDAGEAKKNEDDEGKEVGSVKNVRARVREEEEEEEEAEVVQAEVAQAAVEVEVEVEAEVDKNAGASIEKRRGES